MKEMEYEELPAGHIILDRADRSVLIIESSIPGISFSSNKGVIPGTFKEIEPGVWQAQVYPGVQLITIRAEDYLPISSLRHNFQPRLAWKLRVTPKKGYDQITMENRPEIILLYNPASPGERILGSIDGKVLNLDFKSGSVKLRPSAGAHTIKLNNGGLIWEQSFDLKEGERSEAEVEFTAGVGGPSVIEEPGGLIITSEPSGAIVYMNQVEQGRTELTLNTIPPGTYEIEVSMPLYLPQRKVVEVTPQSYADVDFKLVPNSGRLEITSKPSEALVYLNDNQAGTTPFKRDKYDAGKYNLRLFKPDYYEVTGEFDLEPGGRFIQEFTLNPQFGLLTVTSEPAGAKIYIDEQDAGNTPLQKKKILSGGHLMKLSSEQYSDYQERIIISDGEDAVKHIKLNPNFALLSIESTPSDARVTLSGTSDRVLNTPVIDLKIAPGDYSVKIEKESYEPYVTNLMLLLGGRESIKPTLKRESGNLNVSTTPQGADVFLNDDFKCKTPYIITEIPTGSYRIKIAKKGCDVLLGEVTIRNRQTTNFIKELSSTGTDRWIKRRRMARITAFVLPGGGQFVSGQTFRGLVYLGAFAGSAALSAVNTVNHLESQDKFDEAQSAYSSAVMVDEINHYYSEMQVEIDNMKKYEQDAMMFMSAAAGVYAMQLIDAWIFGGGRKPAVRVGQYGMAPRLIPYIKTDANGTQLSLIIGL